MNIKLYYFKFSLNVNFPNYFSLLFQYRCTFALIQTPPVISDYVLNIGKDTYEDYLAFLFEVFFCLTQNNDEMSSDNHVAYLLKEAFDATLDTFHDEELSILQEKEDMYMYYIMYSTFYVIL